MHIIYSSDHKRHNPQFEIYDGFKEPYAEKVERIETIITALRETQVGTIIPPEVFAMRHITAIHHPEYIRFIKERSESLGGKEILYPSYFINDTYAPITQDTYESAKTSVDIALTGARRIQKGENVVYSLCRPPGHHAEEKAMGGYCYFNNAAIAANYLSVYGTVAILDIDFHHGNGTQQAFYDRSDVLYVSLHADPRVKYPYATGFTDEEGKGEGIGFNKNFPLPLGISDTEYLKILQKALGLVRSFNPRFLVVSAGFDTYEKDPICGFGLTIPFYETMGEAINALGLPTLIIQEGGYFVEDLGKIAISFLKGINPSAF
ncbi:histone deacetylase family protein [soil metagenome]